MSISNQQTKKRMHLFINLFLNLAKKIAFQLTHITFHINYFFMNKEKFI